MAIIANVMIVLLVALLVALVLVLLHYNAELRKTLASRPLPARVDQRKWALGGQPKSGTAAFAVIAALNCIGCLGRSAPEEPVFILVARDRAAADAVRDWAHRARQHGVSARKFEGALEIAAAMDEWRASHGGGKVPD